MNEKAPFQKANRPVLHFTAEKGWINDPNGLVYDGKAYHMFYQYDPDSILHGPMHWGHAKTKDFLTWEHLPIALSPDENGEIFSGSMVMDRENTSCFGADGAVPMVAVFTHHLEQHGRVTQSQSLAYSLDGGLTFEKYAGNPVIPSDMQDFRDPKVFWHVETASWVMVVIGGRNVMFYSSPNLKQWTHTSTFTTPNPVPKGIWECPDLMRFETPAGEKWVLMVSINSGNDGDFGMQYFVGDFDGSCFTVETPSEDVLMLDFGYDNYAAVTYNGITDRTVCIGWMNSWYYAEQIPAQGFRGSMCFPRELALRKTAKGWRLFQQPVRELREHLRSCSSLPSIAAVIEIELGKGTNYLTLKNDQNRLTLKVDTGEHRITLDRSECGGTELGSFFAEPRNCCYQEDCNTLLLLLDRSSIEVFEENGAFCGTMQYVTDRPFSALETSPDVRQVRFYEVLE